MLLYVSLNLPFLLPSFPLIHNPTSYNPISLCCITSSSLSGFMRIDFISELLLFPTSYLFHSESSFLETQLYWTIVIKFSDYIRNCLLYFYIYIPGMVWCLYFTFLFVEINEVYILLIFNEFLSYPVNSYEVQFLCKKVRNLAD